MIPNPTAASILGLLLRRSMSGFELMQMVQMTIGNFWNVTRSQIYRELAALESAQLLRKSEEGPRDRVRYTVTAAGKAAFKAWLEEEPAPELMRHELLIKTFFGSHLPVERLREFSRVHHSGHQARLKRYEQAWEEKVVPDAFTREALRFGIAYERMVLEWIETLPWMEQAEVKKKPRGGR